MSNIVIAFLPAIWVELFFIMISFRDIKDELKEINKNLKTDKKEKSLWFFFFIFFIIIIFSFFKMIIYFNILKNEKEYLIIFKNK